MLRTLNARTQTTRIPQENPACVWSCWQQSRNTTASRILLIICSLRPLRYDLMTPFDDMGAGKKVYIPFGKCLGVL